MGRAVVVVLRVGMTKWERREGREGKGNQNDNNNNYPPFGSLFILPSPLLPFLPIPSHPAPFPAPQAAC